MLFLLKSPIDPLIAIRRPLISTQTQSQQDNTFFVCHEQRGRASRRSSNLELYSPPDLKQLVGAQPWQLERRDRSPEPAF